MDLTDSQRAFLEQNASAAMITLRADGTAHAVRVAVVLVDGKLWSSGTEGRLRTKLLRRDPRCTLFVWESGVRFLTLETTVKLIEGPDVPELSVQLFQVMQAKMPSPPPPGHLMWFGRPLAIDDFRRTMVED